MSEFKISGSTSAAVATASSLQFQANLVRNPAITISTSSPTYNMEAQDFVQSVINFQSLNYTGLGVAGTLFVGADTPSVAASYIGLFQLTSGSASKITCLFQPELKTTRPTENVSLANTSGTANYVQIKLLNGSSASSQVLVSSAGSTPIGLFQTGVEVWATNISSGSQTVVFNIIGNN